MIKMHSEKLTSTNYRELKVPNLANVSTCEHTCISKTKQDTNLNYVRI